MFAESKYLIPLIEGCPTRLKNYVISLSEAKPTCSCCWVIGRDTFHNAPSDIMLNTLISESANMAAEFTCCSLASVEVRCVFWVSFFEWVSSKPGVCVNLTIIMPSYSGSVNHIVGGTFTRNGTFTFSSSLAITTGLTKFSFFLFRIFLLCYCIHCLRLGIHL